MCVINSQLDFFYEREMLLVHLTSPRLAENVSVCFIGERHPTVLSTQ